MLVLASRFCIACPLGKYLTNLAYYSSDLVQVWISPDFVRLSSVKKPNLRVSPKFLCRHQDDPHIASATRCPGCALISNFQWQSLTMYISRFQPRPTSRISHLFQHGCF